MRIESPSISNNSGIKTMNTSYLKTENLSKNNIEKTFQSWAIYFSLIILLITLSPYNFEFGEKSVFLWRISTFDMFENLFLLFPIGVFLTLSNNRISATDIIKYAAIGFIFSLFIESSQLFLKSRTSQYWDVVANTLSMVFGIVTGLTLKPLTKKLSKVRTSIIKLTSTLFAVSILIIIRLMMNKQQFGLFELSLLVCGCGLLILIFNHYSLKKKSLLVGPSSVLTLVFIFISLFPLLLTNITLLLIISLIFGLIVPASVYLMSNNQNISRANQKKIIFTIVYPPIIIFTVLAIMNLITINTDFAIFQQDKIYRLNNGRGVGGVMVQFLLLCTIATQLFQSIFSAKK